MGSAAVWLLAFHRESSPNVPCVAWDVKVIAYNLHVLTLCVFWNTEIEVGGNDVTSLNKADKTRELPIRGYPHNPSALCGG